MLELPPGLAEALFDAAPVPVVVADSRGRVTAGNSAAVLFFGYTSHELRHLVHVSDLYQHVDEAREVMQGARLGAAEGVVVTVRTRSGELVPAKVHARILRDASGEVVGTVGAIEDLREVQELSRRLEDATGQIVASEKRAAVVAVASQAAHELSQPLMAAMGNIELALMQTGLEPKLVGRLEKTYVQLERMKAIVGDFVRMTGARSGS